MEVFLLRGPSKQYSPMMEALNEKALILKAVYEVYSIVLYYVEPFS
jgi:hypothetical protein